MAENGQLAAAAFYLRIVCKQPDIAKAGIEKIIGNAAMYPIITSSSEDATMGFPGNSEADAWPANAVIDASGSNYRRIKMCATLVEKLQTLKDPRLGSGPIKWKCHWL
jgi:hypothetical protein